MNWAKEKKKIKLLGMLFTVLLANVIGRMLEKYGALNLQEWWKIILVFLFVFPCTAILHYVGRFLEKKLVIPIDASCENRLELIGCAVFLFFSWSIVLLGVYPGFFVYDAGDELLQVITRNFTTHHPLLHVLYLGGIVQAGYKIFGTYNAGIFLFFLIQISLFVGAITYAYHKMRTFGFHRYLCRAMIGFMGVFPLFSMCVLCSCKDSIFSLILFLWVITTYEWLYQDSKFCKCRWIICSILMCLLRNNAIYALIVTGIGMIFILKEYRKQITVMLTLTIGMTIVISNAFAGVLHAENGGKQEMLTVPIQQLARAYQYERDVFSKQDEEILLSYIPYENLGNYRPKLSDAVKIGFCNEQYERDTVSFLKLWARIGSKVPMCYLNAWLMTSYGYWYPDAVVDVYKGNTVYTFTYDENSYFGYETEAPGMRETKIPMIDEFYRKLSLEMYKEKIPVVAQLFSMGFMFWVYIWMMFLLIEKRGKKSMVPYSLLFWMIATLMLGPTFLPRYVFFLWLVIPFMLGDIICDRSIVAMSEENIAEAA